MTLSQKVHSLQPQGKHTVVIFVGFECILIFIIHLCLNIQEPRDISRHTQSVLQVYRYVGRVSLHVTTSISLYLVEQVPFLQFTRIVNIILLIAFIVGRDFCRMAHCKAIQPTYSTKTTEKPNLQELMTFVHTQDVVRVRERKIRKQPLRSFNLADKPEPGQLPSSELFGKFPTCFHIYIGHIDAGT